MDTMRNSRLGGGGPASARPGAGRRGWLDWHSRHPARLGQLLVLVVELVLLGTGPALAQTPRAWWSLAGVTAAMLAFLLGSRLVPWDGLPRWALTAFPLSILLGLAALGLGGGGLGSPFGSVVVLCFAYTGLTQSPRVNAALLIPAAAAYVGAMGTWSTAFAIRLPIVISVWFLLFQLLCRLTAYNERLAEVLRAAAQTDAVTGLPNRRDLDLRLTMATARDTLVLCDIDHFKEFNDTFGHLAGDQLLADFGLMLRDGLRLPDYAARYGGDEFALVLVGADLNIAAAVVDRLRREWSVLDTDATFSAGIAAFVPGEGADASLRNADRALYQAKAAGRDRYAVSAQGSEAASAG